MPIKPPPPAGAAAHNAKLVVTLILYSRPESSTIQAAGNSRPQADAHSLGLSPGIGPASQYVRLRLRSMKSPLWPAESLYSPAAAITSDPAHFLLPVRHGPLSKIRL